MKKNTLLLLTAWHLACPGTYLLPLLILGRHPPPGTPEWLFALVITYGFAYTFTTPFTVLLALVCSRGTGRRGAIGLNLAMLLFWLCGAPLGMAQFCFCG